MRSWSILVSSKALTALVSTSAMLSRRGAISERISLTVSSFATSMSSLSAICSFIPMIACMRSEFVGSPETFSVANLARISATRSFAEAISGDKLVRETAGRCIGVARDTLKAGKLGAGGGGHD